MTIEASGHSFEAVYHELKAMRDKSDDERPARFQIRSLVGAKDEKIVGEVVFEGEEQA